MKDSVELARLCSLDIGRHVRSEDVRRYFLSGEAALAQAGFTEEERDEIQATLLKELASSSYVEALKPHTSGTYQAEYEAELHSGNDPTPTEEAT